MGINKISFLLKRTGMITTPALTPLRQAMVAFAFLTIFTSNLFAGEILDSICAVVDNDVILESEVGYGVNSLLLEQNVKRPTALQVATARDQVLQSYITRKSSSPSPTKTP